MANSQLSRIQYISNESKPLTCKYLLKKKFKRNIVFNSLSTYTCLKWLAVVCNQRSPNSTKSGKVPSFSLQKNGDITSPVQMTVVNSNQKQAQQCLLEKVKWDHHLKKLDKVILILIRRTLLLSAHVYECYYIDFINYFMSTSYFVGKVFSFLWKRSAHIFPLSSPEYQYTLPCSMKAYDFWFQLIGSRRTLNPSKTNCSSSLVTIPWLQTVVQQ